jgi:hypothetical protein
MTLIPDYGLPMSNVAPCLLSLHFHGHLVAEDPESCRFLMETIRGCEQYWAQEVLARSLCPYTDVFLLRPWGICVLDVAVCYSPELCVAVHSSLVQRSLLAFSDMSNEAVYRASWLCLRMKSYDSILLGSFGMQDIMEKLSIRLNIAASSERVRAEEATRHSMQNKTKA